MAILSNNNVETLGDILSDIYTGVSGLVFKVELHTRDNPHIDAKEIMVHGTWRYNGHPVKKLEKKEIHLDEGTKITEFDLEDRYWTFTISHSQMAYSHNEILKEKIMMIYEELKDYVEKTTQRFNLDQEVMKSLRNLLDTL